MPAHYKLVVGGGEIKDGKGDVVICGQRSDADIDFADDNPSAAITLELPFAEVVVEEAATIWGEGKGEGIEAFAEV